MSQKDIWRYIHIRWAGRRNHCSFVSIYGTMGVDGRRADEKKKGKKKSLSGLSLSARDNHITTRLIVHLFSHTMPISPQEQ